jgi:hypothetical protein
MSSAPGNQLSRRAFPTPLLFLLFLVLAMSRRWEQLASPQVWAEDGQFIRGFIQYGWREFLVPINGYLVLVPKIITRVSLAASLYYYPVISSVLASVFDALVGLAIARAPSRLSAKALCAISVFLIPSDAEVFGLSLYTLWWASVLLLLVALWDERRPALGLRMLFLIIGGLSSPFIVFLLPVLYFRVVAYRNRHAEKLVAVAATAIAVIQMLFASRTRMALPLVSSLLKYVIPRFCGWFVAGSISSNGYVLWPLGLLVAALVATYWFRNRRDPFAWILVYLYIVAIAASVIRIDPAGLFPVGAGPRYFFFPYVLTFWILIMIAVSPGIRWLRSCAGFIALVAVLNAVPQWSRHHDDLQWPKHIMSARLFSEYDIPIESDGHGSHFWTIQEPGSVWEDLVRRDWFVSSEDLAVRPTFPYRIVATKGTPGPQDRDSRSGVNFADGKKTISDVSDGPRKEIEIRLTTGGRVHYRSGPAVGPQSMVIVGHENEFLTSLPITEDWVTLEFSNLRLPREFTIRIEDQGQGVGEWSASGIQE